MVYKTLDELPLVLKVEQVAEILEINRNTAYELTRSADFPAIRIGKSIRVPKQGFIDWLNQPKTVNL